MANEVQAQMKLGISQAGLDYVVKQLDERKSTGLYFPDGYSIQNAMQSAYLMLREAEDKNGNALLSVCTQDSVVQSLMQMATQGLNPAKKQCYFVAYGNKCKLVPSYFGTLAILNRVKNLERQPVANVVREGDVFEYGYDLDTLDLRIHKHETRIENLDNPVIAAYAVVTTDKERVVEIMSKSQLEKAWAQGQAWKSAEKYKSESKTHANFSEEMAKKTVLNRAAKKLINATDDSSIMSDDVVGAFNETGGNDTLDVVAEQFEVDIKQANSVPFPAEQIEEKSAEKQLDKPRKGREKEPDKKLKPEPSTVMEQECIQEEIPDFMG